MAAVFWVAHLIRVGYRLLQHYEIRTFFETVLEIPDSELCNFTWREVVVRICKVQPQLHLIINQEEITPLDVYQRILRYKNYMIAMVYNVRSLILPFPSFLLVIPTFYVSEHPTALRTRAFGRLSAVPLVRSSAQPGVDALLGTVVSVAQLLFAEGGVKNRREPRRAW